jgi:hypothetical protein
VASVLVLERRFAVCPDTKVRLLFALFPVCQLVGCACQIAWRVATTSGFGAWIRSLRSFLHTVGSGPVKTPPRNGNRSSRLPFVAFLKR